jgi:hypothetical protein
MTDGCLCDSDTRVHSPGVGFQMRRINDRVRSAERTRHICPIGQSNNRKAKGEHRSGRGSRRSYPQPAGSFIFWQLNQESPVSASSEVLLESVSYAPPPTLKSHYIRINVHAYLRTSQPTFRWGVDSHHAHSTHVEPPDRHLSINCWRFKIGIAQIAFLFEPGDVSQQI